MRYYKQIVNGKLFAIGKGESGEEITEQEYLSLLAEIQQKAKLVDEVYEGTKVISDVPEKWQKEIANRVYEQKMREEEQKQSEVNEKDIALAVEAIL